MNTKSISKQSKPFKIHAEFDVLAKDYDVLHKKNIKMSGESPEYFSGYKIADLCRFLKLSKIKNSKVLDFGSGIGNSLPYFRQYFPYSELFCADVSTRSIEVAKSRFPGKENYLPITSNVPLPSNSIDVVFSACVFHHIPPEEHPHWLFELRRITKPSGILAIYEHNPLNPLTVRTVNSCPLDANACLIFSKTMRKQVIASGWENVSIDYKIFFPSFLRVLRPIERYLEWLPIGAQYRLIARRP